MGPPHLPPRFCLRFLQRFFPCRCHHCACSKGVSGSGLCKAPRDNCIVVALYKYNWIESSYSYSLYVKQNIILVIFLCLKNAWFSLCCFDLIYGFIPFPCLGTEAGCCEKPISVITTLRKSQPCEKWRLSPSVYMFQWCKPEWRSPRIKVMWGMNGRVWCRHMLTHWHAWPGARHPLPTSTLSPTRQAPTPPITDSQCQRLGIASVDLIFPEPRK